MKTQVVWEVTLLPDPNIIHCVRDDVKRWLKDVSQFTSTEDVIWLQKEGNDEGNNIYFPV